MRQNWDDWEPRSRRNMQTGGPALPTQYQTLPNQSSMSLDNGSVFNQPSGNGYALDNGGLQYAPFPQTGMQGMGLGDPSGLYGGSPYGNTIPSGYGSSVFDAQPYSNPMSAGMPGTSYGNPSVGLGDPSVNAGVMDNPALPGYPNQVPRGTGNAWASMGSSVGRSSGYRPQRNAWNSAPAPSGPVTPYTPPWQGW